MADIILRRLIAVKGLDGRLNDILLAWMGQKFQKKRLESLTVFFHGDVQVGRLDGQRENIEKCTNNPLICNPIRTSQIIWAKVRFINGILRIQLKTWRKNFLKI